MKTEYPQFLNNVPKGIDLFESGSHKKTATSISEHIKNNASGYKLIGLEGNWGSGKSNIIKIIENDLGKEIFHFFIYDAWSHQEDMQRRSFLEELTEDLTKTDILKEDYNKKLKELLAKKKDTTTKTIPHLSTALVISILVLILTPIAKSISDSISIPVNRTVFDLIIYNIKWIITCIPIFLAIIAFVIYFILERKKDIANDKNYPFTKTLQKFSHSLVSVYKDKNIETTINETISEKEPSIREFRKWMTDLSSDIKDDKHVVVVFDNMDRLPPEKILNLWSSIHTFFSEYSYDKIWLIVPFDRAHIRKAFKNSETDDSVGNHFINKTFPIIYKVSPVVLTDWKKFFDEKFLEAFGENESQYLTKVRSIYDLCKDYITPREIIAFINEIVSLNMIWKKEIPLEYLSLYTLTKEKLENNTAGGINDKSFLGKANLLYRNDEKLSDYISALVYNIPPESATQITLSREILLAIRNREDGKLVEFEKNNKFYQILETVIQTEDWDVDSAAISLNKLNESENNASISSIVWQVIVKKEFDRFMDDIEFTETHKILLRKSVRINLFQKLLNNLIYKISNARNFLGSKYYTSLSEMKAFLSENNIEVDFESSISVRNMTPEQFIDYMSVANENFKYFKATCPNDSLDGFLKMRIETGNYYPTSIKLLSSTYKFPQLEGHIENAIKKNEIDNENILGVFNSYKAISEKPFNISLNGDTVNNLLNGLDSREFYTEKYYELIAMEIAKLDSYPFNNFFSKGFIDSEQEDEKIIINVSKIIEYYVSYGELLLATTTWDKKILKLIVRNLTLNNYGISKLSISKVLENCVDIRNSIKVSDEDFLKRLNGWSSRIKDQITISNFEVTLSIEIFDSLLKVNNLLSNEIIKVAVEYIKSHKQEDWENYFIDNRSYQFNLLCKLLLNRAIEQLPESIFNAYKECLKKFAEGKNTTPLNSIDQWNLIYDSCDKMHLKTTILDIRDYFIRNANVRIENFLFFEKILRENGDLLDKSADVIRNILAENDNNDLCLQKLIENDDFYSSLIHSAGIISFNFIDRIRAKVEDDSNKFDLVAFSNKIDSLFAKDIKIDFAEYFTDEKKMDVTSTIKSKVENDKIIHFSVQNELFESDPNPTVSKRLLIKYRYLNEEKSNVFDENSWVRIP